jgi:predicted TIM-barrel fold metal-dependent hydrolase
VWQYCSDQGIAVAISMRQDGLPHLVDVIRHFPAVRIVLDHLLHAPMDDGPPYAQAEPMFAMARYPNVYLKLTSAIIQRSLQGRATPESFFGRLMNEFGSTRIAWGSNFPAVEGNLPELVAEAKEILSVVSASDQENIFWKTAASLYPALAGK